MRNCKKNCQKLYYSLYSERTTIYEKDSNGEVIYDEIDGECYPRILAETAGYGEPIGFEANITTSGGKTSIAEYGVDLTDYEAVIVTTDKTLPIDELSLIWHHTTPQEHSDSSVDPDSADYKVVAVRPSLSGAKYLLKRLEKGS